MYVGLNMCMYVYVYMHMGIVTKVLNVEKYSVKI